MTATLSVDLNIPLDQLCSEYQSGKTNFIDKITKTPVAFDPVAEFENGVKIGEGSFGVVKKVNYPSAEGLVSVALKEVKSRFPFESAMIARELSALESLQTSVYIPRFYGCSIETLTPKVNLVNRPVMAPKRIFIVLELLSESLDSEVFRNHITDSPKSETLNLFSQMFKGLRDMNRSGLAHNDIKPANMMTDSDMSRVYLIDLGLVSDSNDKILMEGTRAFRPPSKFSNDGGLMYDPKDDMYSIALSIADIVSEKKHQVFAKPGESTFSTECKEKDRQFYLSPACRELIVENMKKILQNAGYGVYQSDADKDTINFTTMMTQMVEYDKSNFSIEDVIGVIDRLIRTTQEIVDLKTKKVKEEDQKEENRIQEWERDSGRREKEAVQVAKRNPILEYYKIENVDKYDLESLEAVLKEIKETFRVKIEEVKKLGLSDQFEKSRLEQLQRHEAMQVRMALITNQVKKAGFLDVNKVQQVNAEEVKQLIEEKHEKHNIRI